MQSLPKAQSRVGTFAPSEVGDVLVATASASASVTMPQIEEVSSCSEETAVVSPTQEDGASTLRLVEEPASASSVVPRDISIDPSLCSRESSRSRMDEVGEVASGAADEGPITIQGEEPKIE
ncbi:hypothetical protein AMTR_s00026p00203420 [Amborella trichopoda]|uniref:Uncharacterized protein n=1 Tax=Amborella trichopoda TaxID=13333 RepID=W1PKA9_AMBTC|nr:hypothetical protein AMTR_s00026p00203420 [Amborella trichopoda]